MLRFALYSLPVAALALAAALVGAAVLLTSDDDAGGAPAAAIPATATSAPAETVEAPAAHTGDVCQGFADRSSVTGERAFAAEYTQIREAAGITIVGNARVDEDAFDVAVQTIERMFASNDLEDELVAVGAYVVIAARDQSPLDLPEFRCLEEEAVGSLVEHACGVADRADYPVATVNELDLLGRRTGPCRGLNILYHELGHLVQGWALGPADYADVRLLHHDARVSGVYGDAYAMTNFREYFAEGTQAYFLSALSTGEMDRDWLAEYDPALLEILERVYGE